MTSATLFASPSAGFDSALTHSPKNRSWIVAALVTLALAILPAVLWPGAISWMCDEPLLIGQACYFNQAYQLAPRGLGGTLFVAYGPFPTQVYQLLLLFTHNLRIIVAIHALALTSVMAGSLLWLSRTLRLSPWYASPIVLAPYLWWGQRVLWDASFALPIGLLGFAAYAAHLRTRSRTTLAVAVGALTLVPLIHLQGIPLFITFAGHALWNLRRTPRRWALVPVALLMVLILNGRYLHDTVRDVTPRLSTIFHSGYRVNQTQTPLLISLSGPFRSGRLFDASTFEDERFHPLGPRMLNRAALFLSELATPLICGGIIVAVMGQLRRRKENSSANDAAIDPQAAFSAAQARATLTRIALATLLLQILLAASLHVPPLPQYCFGTFPIHVFFGWLAIDYLQRIRLGFPVTLIWGASLGFITLGAAWQVHRYGWNRWLLSPSLENQMQVARQLNSYSDTTAWTDVSTYQTYPMAIRELRVIMPPQPGAVARHSRHDLIIRYTSPDPGSQIELIEGNGDVLDPDKFKKLDITPMPKMY